MLKEKFKIGKVKTILWSIASFAVLYTITNGTYAWLTDKTSMLDSSFTYGNIKISINETKRDEVSYTMLPGKKIQKDPIVIVDKKSEDCWLYIQIVKSDNFDDFMTYDLVDGWILLDDNAGIYYRTVSKSYAKQEFMIIKDNIIKVKSDLTKEKLDSLQESKNYPTLSVSAYAVQRDDNIDALNTPEKAWLLVNNQE